MMMQQRNNQRLHMGCGESLTKTMRKREKRRINQQADGVSIRVPLMTKRNCVGAGQ